MFSIEELYSNDSLLDYMTELSRKRYILHFDDYLQEVFVELVEKGERHSLEYAKKVADKIAHRISRQNLEENYEPTEYWHGCSPAMNEV